jgi:hypothetical protein
MGRKACRSIVQYLEEVMAVTEAPGKTAYRVKANSVESCSCQNGCNCQFQGIPNEGKCEFIIAYDVTDGHVGDVSLDGVRFVVAAKYPNAIHEGNGHVALWVDDKATDEQVGALASVLMGKLGGMPWEALAGTITRLDGPIRAAIEIASAGARSAVRVAGAIDVQFTPFLNPITGEENAVHITYPNGGFFWDDGAIATTSTMRAEHGDLKFEWPGKFAAAAEVNWTNQK